MRDLPYDYLVYALGSFVDQDAVPGLREHAYVLNPAGMMAGPQLKTRLAELKNAPSRVLVVGGGATGIEAAAQIKGTNPGFRVELVTQGAFGAFKNERLRRHMLRAFAAQDIAIREYSHIKAVEAGAVITARNERLMADLVLWAGGFIAPALAREAGLAVNERNQLLVDPMLRATTQPEIFVVGDAASPLETPGAPYRMSVFAALVSGAHVADNLARHLRGRAMKPLSFAYYGQAVSLGLKDAVGFATYPVDAVVGPIYRGWLAVSLRNFFIWFLTFAIEMEKTLPGFLVWLGKGRYAASQRRKPSAQPEAPQRG
jgi:NADH dehydrogenase